MSKFTFTHSHIYTKILNTYTRQTFEKGRQKERRKGEGGGYQPIGAALGIASLSYTHTHTHTHHCQCCSSTSQLQKRDCILSVCVYVWVCVCVCKRDRKREVCVCVCESVREGEKIWTACQLATSFFLLALSSLAHHSLLTQQNIEEFFWGLRIMLHLDALT